LGSFFFIYCCLLSSSLLTSLLFYCGAFIAGTVACAEYIMCVWEYLIVTSLAILLIPLMFLDSTKSFAANIIKIFLSYFAKLMVVTMACFYSLSLFLDITSSTYQKGDFNAISTIVTYLLVLVLSVSLAAGSEKISSVLFTGSPRMSMGDIVQGARDLRMAGAGALGAGKKAAGAAVKGMQAAGRGIQNLASLGAGMSAAKHRTMDAMQSLRKSDPAAYSGMTDRDIRREGNMSAGRTFWNASKQAAGDIANKVLFGTERDHTGSDGARTGFYKSGQSFMDNASHQHTGSFKNISDQAKEMGKAAANEKVGSQEFLDRFKNKDNARQK